MSNLSIVEVERVDAAAVDAAAVVVDAIVVDAIVDTIDVHVLWLLKRRE